MQQRGSTLRKRGLHRLYGLVSHGGQEVRVGVEAHRYRSVPQELLDELRVSALSQ